MTLVFALTILSVLASGCTPKHEAARLEARPSGKYAEILSWTANAAEAGPSHRVEVEIEIDEAQLMGWARSSVQYNTYLDVRLEQPGVDRVETMLMFPITEERIISQSKEVIQIAYQAAGTMQPSGFRLVPHKVAFAFKPKPGANTISVHIRTPAGADRQALRGIRTARLRVLTGKDGPTVLKTADWVEQPRRVGDW